MKRGESSFSPFSRKNVHKFSFTPMLEYLEHHSRFAYSYRAVLARFLGALFLAEGLPDILLIPTRPQMSPEAQLTRPILE